MFGRCIWFFDIDQTTFSPLISFFDFLNVPVHSKLGELVYHGHHLDTILCAGWMYLNLWQRLQLWFWWFQRKHLQIDFWKMFLAVCQYRVHFNFYSRVNFISNQSMLSRIVDYLRKNISIVCWNVRIFYQLMYNCNR